jgi:hypothetical protein
MTAVISARGGGSQAGEVKFGDNRTALFRARFRQTRLYQAAVLVPAGGGVFLLSNARRYSADFGFAPILLAAAFLIAVAALFSWFNWRCPACRTHLGLHWNPHHCPGCGFVLRSR